MELSEKRKSRALSAELAVIGALLLEPERWGGEVFHKLRAEDFGDATYRNLYKAARQIWLDQKPLDAVTLQGAVGKDYTAAIVDAMQLTPTTANTAAYADIVAQEARLRALQEIGSKLTFLEDLDEAQGLLSKAENLLTTQDEERVWGYRELLDDFLTRQNGSAPLDYLDWGIPELNENVRISQGRFVILGAQSSTGKTALALQLAYSVAKSGKRVGFFSYETSHEDAADRIFANTAGVAMSRSKRKQMNQFDAEEIEREWNLSDKISFTLEDSGDWTVDEIRARTLAQRYEVIFVDYVQIIPGDPKKPRWEVVTDISMKLHRMAQKLRVTVIALSQVTAPEKDSKGKRRVLTKEDLRESQQLANDAEAVLLMELTIPGNYDSERELIIDKNKDGKHGRMWLKFDPDHMRFTPCPQPDHQKKAEYRAKMAKLRKEQKADRQAEYQQMGLEELPGGKDDLPF